MCPPKAKPNPEPAAEPALPDKPIEDPSLMANSRAQDQAMFGASGQPQLRRTDPTVANAILPADVGLKM